MAALRGHEKVVDVIVSFCEFYNLDWMSSEVNKDGWTPLMAAAVADRCNVARCLIYAASSSASKLACMKNRYGQTALHVAAYRSVQTLQQINYLLTNRGCAEMVDLLLSVGGSQLESEVDSYGRSALSIARCRDKEDVATLLIHHAHRRRRRLPHVDFRARWRSWIANRDCALDYHNL